MAGAGLLMTAFGVYYYISHLEATPITGRRRFNLITTKDLEELSQLEFQKVIYPLLLHHIL